MRPRDSVGELQALLSVARQVAMDGQQRAMDIEWDSSAQTHQVRLELREALRAAALPVAPWVWSAATSGGSALTESGRRLGFELRLSKSRAVEPRSPGIPPTAALPKHAGRTAPADYNADVLGLQPQEVLTSPILRSARDGLQYPVARAVRAAELAADPRSQFDAVVEIGEMLTLVLGTTIAALARQRDPGASVLRDLHKKWAGPGLSQGTWLNALPALSDAVGERADSVDHLLSALRGDHGQALAGDLDVLRQERNAAAHGSRPRNAGEALRRITAISPVVERVVDAASGLRDVPWLVCESTSYRKDGTFRVTARRAMGDHPDFELFRLQTTRPLFDGMTFIETDEGPADLGPYIVFRYCEDCRQPELCQADRVDRDSVILKSFANAHVIRDDTMAAEINRR